jgi:hypothetical protein
MQALESRQFLSATIGHAAAGGGIASPAIVVQPAFTPVLGTYAGDLLAGSEFAGFSATGKFKLTVSSYNASTGVLTGTYYTEDIVADGKAAAPLIIPFHGDAHLTSAGGFDLHIAGKLGNVKLKGDYKRDGTYISGSLSGTAAGASGRVYDFDFIFDLSKRS